MKVLETDRLVIRHLVWSDDAFILELVNEPSWIQNIGDRNIHTIEASRDYIASNTTMYANKGIGSYLIERKGINNEAIGICGLLKRETLNDVDLGFAVLERFCRQGYGYEAAFAMMNHAKHHHRLNRLVAITSPSNEISQHLLLKLGFQFEEKRQLVKDGPEVKLFAVAFGR